MHLYVTKDNENTRTMCEILLTSFCLCFLLLTIVNKFHTLIWCFQGYLEQVNASWIHCIKMRFSIKDFFSFLRIWKSSMEKLIFCAVMFLVIRVIFKVFLFSDCYLPTFTEGAILVQYT